MPKILNDLKTSILQEVEKLLQTRGYNAVTIRSVARGCGVGVGTVYNYFSSKEAMLAEYLLTDWLARLADIGRVEADAEKVAHCMYDELLQFAGSHMTIFDNAGAKASFVGAFSQYHGLLRSQLAKPLRPFCKSDFAAEFAAEALLTWAITGKEFAEIWELLAPSIKE